MDWWPDDTLGPAGEEAFASPLLEPYAILRFPTGWANACPTRSTMISASRQASASGRVRAR